MREARRAMASVLLALTSIAASCSQIPVFAVIYTFEAPEPGMDEPGGWVRESIYGANIDDAWGSVSGVNAMRIGASYRTVTGGLPPPPVWNPTRLQFEGTAYRPHAVSPGRTFTVAAHLNADNTPNEIRLICTIHDGAPDGPQMLARSIAKSELAAGFQPFTLGSFMAASPTVYIKFHATDPQAREDTDGGWAIDDLEIEEQEESEGDMAVFLSGFAKRAALARAQTALNAEIVFVKQEANTGLDLPIVTGWRAYDPGAATPDVAEFEVYPRGAITFPHNSYDQSRWTPGARTIVTCVVPMRAAINHANLGNDDASGATLLASQMQERSDWYGAALLRTYRNDPTCGQGTAAIRIVPQRLDVRAAARARMSGDLRTVARVEFDFDMYLQEQPTNETVVGGAALPAVTTLESP